MNKKLKSVKAKIDENLEKCHIRKKLAVVGDKYKLMRNRTHRIIAEIAKSLSDKGVSANVSSVIGFAIGLLAINFLAMYMFGWALVCILLNRIFDAIDGEIARKTKVTNFGIFLDAALDYIFYTGVIFGFALANPPQNAVAAAFLLFGFAASACAMLAYAVVASKDKPLTDMVLLKSPFYLGGAAQGAETFIALIIMCLVPSWFMELAIFFGVVCLIKAFSIIISAYYTFVIAPKK